MNKGANIFHSWNFFSLNYACTSRKHLSQISRGISLRVLQTTFRATCGTQGPRWLSNSYKTKLFPNSVSECLSKSILFSTKYVFLKSKQLSGRVQWRQVHFCLSEGRYLQVYIFSRGVLQSCTTAKMCWDLSLLRPCTKVPCLQLVILISKWFCSTYLRESHLRSCQHGTPHKNFSLIK